MKDWQNAKQDVAELRAAVGGMTSQARIDEASGLSQAQARYRPSLIEEQHKNAIYHQEQADKSAAAAAFFKAHPEFDEFVGLIRTGVISI